jgi:multiple sugar transport system ATP-binding protein
MVFQNYALYPHMTVARNMGFPLRAARVPKPEIDRRVREAAVLLGLEALLERRPGELSGGQRQRVAMGRALVRNPQVFLFDEPLSNLDAQLRNQVRTDIKKLHQQVRTTSIYVTHDQVEATTLADRIVLLRDGLIEQVGTPMELFERPANRFVARFIGAPAMNVLAGQLEGETIVLPFARLPCPNLSRRPADGRVEIGIRPEDVRSGAHFSASVAVVEPLGAEALVMLEAQGTELQMRIDGRKHPRAGQTMQVAFDLEHLHVFDAQSGHSLRHHLPGSV